MSKKREMKTAIAHRRQVALVARSLIAMPDRRPRWDERTRTSREVRAA